MSINPKEHPTFKRAMSLAHHRLMSQNKVLNARIEALLKERRMDQREAANIALAGLAQQAYEDAVETLGSECSRRVRVEYVVSGDAFLSETAFQVAARGQNSALFILNAAQKARAAMPREVRSIHNFGCREDGLIFGTTRYEPLGGNFATFHDKIIEEIHSAALASARESQQGADESFNFITSSESSEAFKPSLLAIAERSFPQDDPSGKGRPLCTHADEMCARLAKLDLVVFCADSEPRHHLSGEQACERLRQITLDAHAERPDASAISQFFLSIGY